MPSTHPVQLAALVLLATAACGNPATIGGMDASDAGGSVDGSIRSDANHPEEAADRVAPSDASIPNDHVGAADTSEDDTGRAPLFRPCTGGGDCVGAGMNAQCLTGFPGGVCSGQCSVDSDCGSGGLCVDTICTPSCTEGGLQCDAYGGACYPVDPADPTRLGCVASCFPTGTLAPAGFPVCPNSQPCQPITGACGAPAPTGAPNGAPCTSTTQCQGELCILQMDPVLGPTGFLGGDCASLGRQPATSAFQAGQPVPQSNCPPGSGILPQASSQAGDLVPCVATCAADQDCRAGYACDHTGGFLNDSFSNGYCLPLDCAAAGMACPRGTQCITQTADGGMNTGTCE